MFKLKPALITKVLPMACTSLFLAACGPSQTKSSLEQAQEGFKDTVQLQIVDCLLPGTVNRLGNMTYVSERRATRTTAHDCNVRGGEYVAYDRADYRSALNVWLKSAKSGDAKAQTYVGEIFEKGLGQEVDFKMAAHWYGKAAAQGYQRAQINLGYLYEKGLGVEKDLATALSLYRLSAGGEELVLASEAKEELEAVRTELNTQIGAAKQQSSYLTTQLANLKAEQERKAADTFGENLSTETSQIEILQSLLDKSQTELKTLNQKIASLPKATYRSIAPDALIQPVQLEKNDPLEFNNIEFGRYFALIIGNQDYLYIDPLQSPRNDALRLQEILENKYGFSTVTLFDASEKEILNAFNDLYGQITPEDNLLVFYAGHGNLSESESSFRKRGYWLPINAEERVLTNWISNSVISDHLDRIKARSVLVIADSCFAGNLASERSAFLMGGLNMNLSEKSIHLGLSRRSRLVISSGGEKPVLDGSENQHSIFANALIHLLENNEGILRDNMLFSQVAVNVRQVARYNEIDQTPEMRPIRAAGHEGGDFFFVPVNASVSAKPETFTRAVRMVGR